MGGRGLACALGAAALLLGARPASVRSEDAAGAAPVRADAPFVLRLYPVGSLLRGHPVFQGDRGPFAVSPEEVNDEASPLYGSESDERVLDVGRTEDLVDTLRRETGEPGAWEREGVSIGLLEGTKGALGHDLLLVAAPRDLEAQVAAWLERAAREALRTVVLDVAAFRGDAVEARAAGGVAAAVARGAWVPLGAVRMTLHAAGSAVGRAGAIRAYLQDHDVEVAIDASTSVPIVGVAPEGLSVEAASAPAGDGRASIHLRGWWASPPAGGTFRTGAGDLVEAPDVEGVSFQATIASGDGTWSLLPGSGPVVFAARARVEAIAPASGPCEGAVLSPTGPVPAEGALVTRSHAVGDLLRPVESARGWTAMLWPTNFTPMEPPELPETAPPISRDALVSILRRAPWKGTWEREGSGLEVSERLCRAVTDEARQAEVAAVLSRLRAARLTMTSVRARVVAMPWASLPEWWTGLPDDFARDGGAGLLARAGARVVEDSSLLLHDGERRAALTGARRTYLAGYGMEIATWSVIGKPVVGSLFDGASLDVEAAPVFGAPAVSLALRLDAGRVLEMRSVPTCFGPIECPLLGLARSRGEVTVPIGAARVVAAWASDGEIRLVLVTASREEPR